MKVRGFEAPLGWEPQPVSSYARLLAAWETRDGGRLTLVAQAVKSGATARGLADESRPALTRQRIRDLRTSAGGAGGRRERPRGRSTAWSTTGTSSCASSTSSPAASATWSPWWARSRARRQMRRDFDEAATSLTVGDAGTPLRRPGADARRAC